MSDLEEGPSLREKGGKVVRQAFRREPTGDRRAKKMPRGADGKQGKEGNSRREKGNTVVGILLWLTWHTDGQLVAPVAHRVVTVAH